MSELAVPEVVAGYRFFSDSDPVRDGQIVQIVERAEVAEWLRNDMGPCFVVRFPDGHEAVAMSMELSPWFEL